MHFLNLDGAIKISHSMKLETLSLKAIINRLGFQRKTVTIQKNIKKKIYCL